METNYSFLALGDSYTIGEAVPLQKSFPYQTIQFLRKKGFNFHAPEIVAKTGWTSDELRNAIAEYSFLYTYDFVSLQIGVNNQYRGYSNEAFEKDFIILLSKAILLANKTPEHVFVLSIPDYSKTSFAKDLDSERISMEIDQYNEVIKRISEAFGAQYIDVTSFLREEAQDASLTAADGLHPSQKVYAKWASMLGRKVFNLLTAEIVS